MDRIGFVGLGIMGSRQAANLRRAGYELTVYNRTRERAEAWAAEHGATVAATPAEVGAASDVAITMVVDGAQVQEVVLGEDGVAHGAAEGSLFVDMSTISPGDSRRIARRARAARHRLRRRPGHRLEPQGAGRDADDHGQRRRGRLRPRPPALRGHGRADRARRRRGRPGRDGQAHQQRRRRGQRPHLAQALVVGRATGIDLDALAQVMGAGSGGSAMLALKAGPMREHDYATLFKLEHMLKDVRLCLEEGQAAGVPFPAAAAFARPSRQAWAAASATRTSPRSWRRSRASPACAFRRAHTTVHRSLHAVCSFGAQRCAIAPFGSHTREESVSRGADVVPRRHLPAAPRARLTLIGGSGGTLPPASATPPSRDAGEPVVRARVAAITDRCWQCRTKVRGIVGVLVDPARTPDSTGFLPFDDVSEMLADRLDPRALAGRRIGRVAHRESPASPAATWPMAASSGRAHRPLPARGPPARAPAVRRHLRAARHRRPRRAPGPGAGEPPQGARIAPTRHQNSTETLRLAGLFGFSAQPLRE